MTKSSSWLAGIGLRLFIFASIIAMVVALPMSKEAAIYAQPIGLQHDHQAHMQHMQQQATRKRYFRTVRKYELPEITLVDMNNDKVTLDSELNYGGPILVQFIFTTCPTICPALSGIFSAAQGKLKDDLDKLRMVSISIDPEYDTPARLKEYAQKFKAGAQWHFLTGRREDIHALQRALDAFRDTKMAHEPLTYLRASPQDAWVRLDGLMSAEDLASEYRQIINP